MFKKIAYIIFSLRQFLLFALLNPKKIFKLPDEIWMACKTIWIYRANLLFGNGFLYYIFGQRNKKSTYDLHYVIQSWWGCKRIGSTNVEVHYDFSSSIPFVANLSALKQVCYHEYNPPALSLPNIKVLSADLLRLNYKDASLDSISCFHVLEHIGLGRYGDALDPDGYLIAINELKRVCSIGGRIYITVPVGKDSIYVNAHRVFDANKFTRNFTGFSLVEFSCVLDGGELLENVGENIVECEKYALGMFCFEKFK